MNLWTLASVILLTLGLSVSPVYHLPTMELVDDHIVITEEILSDTAIIPHKVNNQSVGVKISAQAAAVMDKSTGSILWQKRANEVRPLASITKLMTALVFLENNPGWDTEVSMTEDDEVDGGIVNLMRGEVVTVEDLFNLTLVASDNRATKALVRSTGLEEKDFVKLMNQKTKELGLSNTVFAETTGLSEANVSTAIEVLTLAKKAFEKDIIKEVTQQKTFNLVTKGGRSKKIYSTNQLLNSYLDINAGKTGHITASGYCLVAQVINDTGQEILAVVLGSDSNPDRFYDLKVLTGWILKNFTWS